MPPAHWFSVSNSTQAPPACSDSNSPESASDILSSPSFLHARAVSDQLRLGPLHRSGHLPPTAGLAPAELAPESNATAEILRYLPILATWLRLRDPTLPDDIVGQLDSDPWGIADQFGVKGLSVYTVFIDLESFRCRVCCHQSTDEDLAVFHQRQRRHFQQ